MKLTNKEQYVLQGTIVEYRYDTIEEMINHEHTMYEIGYEVSSRRSLLLEYKREIKQNI
jgi:hypothetical protein